MDIEKLDLSDPSTWTTNRIIDQFISDVLLPDKDGRLMVSDLFDVFKDYCEQMEFANVVTKIAFGTRLAKRFQRVMIMGKPHYCAIIKPELVVRD